MGNHPTCSLEYATETLDPRCNKERMWPIFILSSWITFLFFGTCILIYLLIENCYRKGVNDQRSLNRFYRFHTWLNKISFGKTILGQIYVRIENKN